jgi:hypothetical protein
MKIFDFLLGRNKIEESKKPKKSKKIKLDETIELFPEIERFNVSKYMSEMFDDIFRAVQYKDWLYEFTSYGEMNFKKDGVVLKIYFSEWNGFYIKKIELISCPGYTPQTFEYKEELDETYYTYFYEKYRSSTIERNENKRRRVENSMSEIRKALGKDVIRDGKIDFLLNSDDE